MTEKATENTRQPHISGWRRGGASCHSAPAPKPRPKRQRPASCHDGAPAGTATKTEDGARAQATVALVGNPNVGKSTVFNALTGARQRVGNWPGTTVHVVSGRWTLPAGTVELVDLPGTYSLIPRSPDEALVRDLLLDREAEGSPDVVVAIVDAANLARNLYLLTQVFDTGIPVVVALTMLDIAADRGLRVDPELLSAKLGVPVIAVGARARGGTDRLVDAVTKALGGPSPHPPALGEVIEPALGTLVERIEEHPAGADRFSRRWLALELLTGNDTAKLPEPAAELAATLRPEAERLRAEAVPLLTNGRAGSGSGDSISGDTDLDGLLDDEADLETEVAERRYAWVHKVVSAGVDRPAQLKPTISDRVDRALTSRWLGLPFFMLILWGVFVATTTLATPLVDGLGSFVDGPVTDAANWLLKLVGLSGGWVEGLVVDGLVAGVGTVLTFAPLMLIMFVLLALLEDSGYMARAALAADRFLRQLGLPGRAFLPLIVGFGCNVPAIYATRVLHSARHRLMTSLLVPYTSCTARLTVYLLLANVFFGSYAGSVVFIMYVISVVLVLLVGLALRHTVFRNQPREAMVIELPPYRLPTVRVVSTQTWQEISAFLRKAGGIIVTTVMAVWLLTAIPLGAGHGTFGKVDVSDSMYGGISRTVAPVFAPAGFGDWHATGALVTGFVAKEAVVSTFAQTYGADDPTDNPRHAGGLGPRLKDTFERTSDGNTGPAVLAFMIFLLAYTPCVATLATQRAEIGGRWTTINVGLQVGVAWLLATLVFQIGSLIV